MQSTGMAASVKLSMDPVRVRVVPGSTAAIEIVVQNTGDDKDVFSIDVLGLDDSWYELSVTSAVLFPGDMTTSTLIIAPPRQSSTVAREYPFRVTVNCQQSLGQSADALGGLSVGRFYECSAVLRPESAIGREETYTVSIENESNFDVAFIPEGEEPNRKFIFIFDHQRFSLPPGQSLDFPVEVNAGWRPLVSPTRPHPFWINLRPAQEGTSSFSLAGTLYVKHRIPLPTWVVPVTLGIASLIGIAVWQIIARV